ncbi:MAG: hypothetical protein JXB49_15015 [Bacteroidales bacterium]|nr:hypothetical protein [Bacteroidales bacterium]
MKNEKRSYRFGLVLLLIIVAAVSRMFPHPANFTPIGAIALFGAAYLKRRWLAVAIPLVSIFLSDVILNNTLYAQYNNGFTLFYNGFAFTYAAIALVTLMGFITLRKIKVANVLLSGLGASVIFFLVSNLGAWVAFPTYPHTGAGLMACYAAGIPFFKYTLLSNLMYSAILFGAFELVQKYVPVLQLKAE